MASPIVSRIVFTLTLIGAVLSLASGLGIRTRFVLLVILGFFALQAAPVLLMETVFAARRRRRALDRIDQLGGRVTARLATNPHRVIELDLSGTKLAEADLDQLNALPSLEALDLSNTPVSDAGLEWLSRMRALRRLHLDRTAVTDRGLMLLRSFPRLEWVSLIDTAVTEQGVDALRFVMPQLQIIAPPVEEVLPAG